MNWDDLRYFLAVAREGQMLSAARRLGVSQALLSRHIATLEEAANARLLDRTTRGCSLTADGQILFETAETIEASLLSGLSRIAGQEDSIAGTIRIGAPDGFGSAYLATKLDRFREVYPDLNIQLVPVPRNFSLSQREADVAIMVGRPEKGRLRVRKLTDFTLGLYAARSYLDHAPRPENLSELNNHPLVGYVEDLIYTPELNYTGELLENWQSDIEVSTAIGQFAAVKAGAGIGILHDFMAVPDADLIPLFPQTAIHRSYWIVWHENLRVARRVKAVVDFLELIVKEQRSLFIREE
ncbi:MAG: LysR family transcriptional regulator [Mangrovicoccus sp.]